ncbi:MAG: hypothetical protein R2711_09240 [Acidimicrobiales bacterium]
MLEQVRPRHPLPTSSPAASRADRPGANWVNQNVIDGVVNLVGTTARKSGELVRRRIDQGVVDTVVNGSGTFAEGSGQLLRRQQNGKVQFYGAYLFIGAAVLAALIIAIA